MSLLENVGNGIPKKNHKTIQNISTAADKKEKKSRLREQTALNAVCFLT
jgi:hypothetical protein